MSKNRAQSALLPAKLPKDATPKQRQAAIQAAAKLTALRAAKRRLLALAGELQNGSESSTY